MSRRRPRSPRPPDPRRPDPPAAIRTPSAVLDSPEDSSSPARIGERIRRAALGLSAALIVARTYTTSEPDLERGAGGGLVWILALLVVFGLAIASGLLGGRFRFRWSWADLAVVAMSAMVALSSLHSLDRRPALNLAWEWAAMAGVYLLLRNLPRTRDESSAIAGALVASAFALSVYGIYQGAVELPEIRREYERNPVQFLQKHPEIGVAPGTPEQFRFEQRLLGSNEITSTFALANSLAGFLVGPFLIAIGAWLANLFDREPGRSRGPTLLMAAPVLLVLLLAMMLTKSRSSWVGMTVGIGILAWEARRRASRRLRIAAGAGGFAIVMAIVAVGWATGRLDREVLTQSTLSMRYRWEYWQATWSVITGGASNAWRAVQTSVFWSGVGPGNFRSAYLRYKLPWSSEEVLDPHNMVLEVWATAGVGAMVSLVLALGLGLRGTLGKAGESVDRPEPESESESDADDAPPIRARWLVVSAWAGGILVVFLGMMNLFVEAQFPRWLILGWSWLLGAWLIGPLWRRRPPTSTAIGAGVAAVAVNLLAAGGIGVPNVAIGLWAMLAIGLNLRDDRPCGRLHEWESRLSPFVLATAWAALAGVFLGAVVPFWKAEALCDAAETALNRQPPHFEAAEAHYQAAIKTDHYDARPWVGYAEEEYLAWRWRGARTADGRWRKVIDLLARATRAPRNPMNWGLHVRRAERIRAILHQIANDLKPVDDLTLRSELVRDYRTASLYYPSNARLHARLAEASTEISMGNDAINEAREALRLDDLNPHPDKKLTSEERDRLEAIVAGGKSIRPSTEAAPGRKPPGPPVRTSGKAP